MAALGAMLRQRGLRVTGSDEGIYPPMSDFLAQSGIPVADGYGPQNLPRDLDLVVIGNAISRGNPEVEEVLDRGLPYRSMPEVLREWFIQGKRSVVVTGTHGKTTTASLLAWILLECGRDPSFLVGGIPKGFSSGYRLGGGPEVVLEGDEYDTAFFDKRPKFVHYLPRIVTLGALEYDHADIYPTMDDLLAAFKALLRVLPRGGRLIINGADGNAARIGREAPCRVIRCTVEEGEEGEFHAYGLRLSHGKAVFRLRHRGKEVGECLLGVAGRHNVLNALLALAAAHETGVPLSSSMGALATFQGVRRRLELVGEMAGALFYDDFAHHPTAIRCTLETLRGLYPSRRLWAVFEPRSNTMCLRVFQDRLPEAFSQADSVVIGGVHRAQRIPPEQRLDPQAVVRAIQIQGREAWYVPSVPEIVSLLQRRVKPLDVVCIMSNGGFGGIHRLLREAFGEA